MNITKQIIKKEGNIARNKAPLIFGNCDYIAREFSKQLIDKYEIDESDIRLLVVNVKKDNKNYTDGHTIVYIKDKFYIELSLDQFNNTNKDYTSISFGNKENIDGVQIFTDSDKNWSYYEIKNELPLR